MSFKDGVRKLSPTLKFPYTKARIALGTQVKALDVHLNDGELVIAVSDGQRLALTRYRNVEDGLRLSKEKSSAIELTVIPKQILLGPRNQWGYLISSEGEVEVLGIESLELM